MKILLLNREFPPHTHGGIGSFYSDLARELTQRGHIVYVLAERFNSSYSEKHKNLMVYRITKVPIWGKSRFLSSLIYNYFLGNFLVKLLKKTEIDIIESSSSSGEAYFYCFRKTVPLVVRLHGLVSFETFMPREEYNPALPFSDGVLSQRLSTSYRYTDSLLCGILERRPILCADSIVSPSQAFRKQTCELLNLDTSKVRLIHHGIAPTRPRLDPIKYNHFKDSLNIGKNKVVLFAGRVSPAKGAHVLLKAIPNILKHEPDVKFIFCGRVSKGIALYFKTCLSNSEQKKVLFTSRIDREELFYFYQVCDVFCHPSFYECSPIVLLEAMLFEKPIVACNVGPMPEIVENNQTGFLVPTGDSEKLSDSVLTLLNDEELRLRFGRNGTERLHREFNIEVTASKTIELYEKLS